MTKIDLDSNAAKFQSSIQIGNDGEIIRPKKSLHPVPFLMFDLSGQSRVVQFSVLSGAVFVFYVVRSDLDQDPKGSEIDFFAVVWLGHGKNILETFFEERRPLLDLSSIRILHFDGQN